MRDLSCELTLTIDGTEYDVHELDLDGRWGSYVVLTKCDDRKHYPRYTCEARRYYDPRETLHDGRWCDCPDFAHRHAGTGSDGCKHLRALAHLGLLRPVPEADRHPADRIDQKYADRETAACNR